ncbi:CopD family protein [Flavobacterium phycosphaerae]|uniref:CopD family protein n=1 Tax=Flavobacterium phycosphaerae TaxID=2697515 RepID=UPI00138A014D|nr:CopD family protein [Flavobacterium phycosphaerae]
MYHHLLLIAHLLAATIWVGGHLFLSLRFLSEAMRNKDVTIIQNFKDKFEPIGMPALVVSVLTGILMAYDYDVTFTHWFSFSGGIEKVVSVKLILLLITVGLAVNAQLFLFPKLTSKELPKAALQIILVTLIGVAMLVLGSLIRIGGL